MASPNIAQVFVNLPTTACAIRPATLPCTDRTAPNDVQTVLPTGSVGTKAYGIIFRALTNTVDGSLWVWMFDDSLSEWVLLDEIRFDAATVSVIVPGQGFVWNVPISPFPMKDVAKLGFTVTDNSSWAATAVAASLSS